jgi:hypothetical protein
MSSGSTAEGSRAIPVTSPPKRGFFGKLKDKAIGTKEEREAERRKWAEVGLLILSCSSESN